MRIALVITALVGLAISAVLVRMSLPDERGASHASSLCTPTARINCDYVLASHWSKLGPVPTAVAGLLYFSILAAWHGVIGVPNHAGRKWRRVPILLNGVGLIASLFFVVVMATRLPVWCTWCLAAHGVNLLLLILTIAARPRLETAGAPPRPADRTALGVIGGSIAAAFTIGSLILSYQMQLVARHYQLESLKATNNAEFVLWRISQSARHELPIRMDDFQIGPANAPHAVIVYSDFECANCFAFHRYAARLTNLFPSAVRIVFRHFPLSRACNDHIDSTLHYFSCDAARAAEAVRRVGNWEKSYAYHQRLFESAANFAEQPYERLAVEVGLDAGAWRKAWIDPATETRVRSDVSEASRLGVEGTPAIFLDGRRLESWHLLTSEPSPKVDLAATDQLWQGLLGASPGAP